MKLNNKTILFIGGPSGRNDLMLAIYKDLSLRYKIKPHFLSILPGSRRYITEKGISPENISEIIYENQTKILRPNTNFIRKAEDKYGFKVWDIWQIAAPRMKSRLKIKPKKILCWMEYVIRETENLLDKVKPDYVFLIGVASFSTVILYKILMNRKINILQLINSRLPKKFTINNNLKDRWPLLAKNYAEIKKRNLSKNERESAEEIIRIFKTKRFKPDDSAKVKESFSKKIQRYNYYFKILKKRKKLPDLRQWTVHPIKDRILKNSKRFEKPLFGEKFIFYPLQVQPEASTSIMGKWYINQLALIENISKCLPCNYKLYVKENNRNYSRRPKNFHKEIKKYPNVRLISPYANTFEIIQNSSLICTITGTVGREAIFLQKPVLTFGNVFYNIFDEVKQVDKISELPKLINERVDIAVDKIKTLKFVAAMNNSVFEGSAALPGDCKNRTLEQKNIKKLVMGIEKYIEVL